MQSPARVFGLFVIIALGACDTPKEVRQLSTATADLVIALDQDLEQSSQQLNRLNEERNVWQERQARFLIDKEKADTDLVRVLHANKADYDRIIKLSNQYIAAEESPVRKRLVFPRLVRPIGLPELATGLDSLGHSQPLEDRLKFLVKFGQVVKEDYKKIEDAEDDKRTKEKQEADKLKPIAENPS